MKNRRLSTGNNEDSQGVSSKSGGALQIIQNVLVNWMAYAVTIVVGFFMSPFLVHQLGDSAYGIWILLGSLTGYLGLLDFGLTPSIVKTVAEYRAKGDQAAINRLATGGFAIFFVLGSLSFALSCVLAFYFNDVFNNPLSRSTTAIIVLLTGLNLALTFPASVFLGILRGFQRYDIDATVSTIALLARTALIIGLLLGGHGIVALAIATFAFDIARLAYLSRAAYRINPELKIARGHIDRGEMRKLFGHSSHFFLIAVGNRINYVTDAILIGMLISAPAVTIFSIPLRLITYLRELVIEMTGVLMPAITHLHATEATDRVRELHIRATKYVALLSLPIAAIFWFLGDSFINLWMGPGYEECYVLLQILTVGILLHLLGTSTGSVLTGLGRQDVVARFSILQAITNLALTLLLIKPLGLVGAALGTTISMGCFFVWLMPVYFRHYIKQPLAAFISRSLVPPLIIQVPFVALLLGIKVYFPLNSLLLFFIVTGIAMSLYSLLAYIVCFSPDERRIFSRIIDKFGIKLAQRGT